MPSLAAIIECLKETKKENILLKEELSSFCQRASLVLIKQELITNDLLNIIEKHTGVLPECSKMAFPEFNESDQ